MTEEYEVAKVQAKIVNDLRFQLTRVTAQRDDLIKFAKHKNSCAEYLCTCGLSKLKAAIEAATKE